MFPCLEGGVVAWACAGFSGEMAYGVSRSKIVLDD